MGQNPNLPHCNSNGRFTPKSSRNSDKPALTLCAKSMMQDCACNLAIALTMRGNERAASFSHAIFNCILQLCFLQ